MANTKRKKHSFFQWLVLFILLIGAISLIAGTRMLTDILSEYENSRPEHFMEKYMQSLDEGRASVIADTIDYEYDHNLMTADELKALFIKDFPSGEELAYKRNGALCTDNRMGYYIVKEKTKLGVVVIEQEKLTEIRNSNRAIRFLSEKIASVLGCSYGKWSIVSEEYDFKTPSADTLRVTVPTDWSVKCNGYTLDSSYIKGEPVQMESYKDYYDMTGIPYLVTYEVSAYTGGAQLETFNEYGEAAVLSDDMSVNERTFTEKYFDNGNEEVQQFTMLFLDRFTRYGSGAQGDRYGNLDSLRRVLLPGSDFESRMVQALDGQYYAHSRGDVITDITYNAILPVENGWFVDFTYTLDTTGNKGVVTTSHNARINIVEYDGGLRVSQMLSY